jgi:hypothetical protein
MTNIIVESKSIIHVDFFYFKSRVQNKTWNLVWIIEIWNRIKKRTVQLGQPSNFWPIFPFNPRASPFLPMLHTRALPPTLLAHWPASDFHARIKHGHWFVGPRCQLQPHAEAVACLCRGFRASVARWRLGPARQPSLSSITTGAGVHNQLPGGITVLVTPIRGLRRPPWNAEGRELGISLRSTTTHGFRARRGHPFPEDLARLGV